LTHQTLLIGVAGIIVLGVTGQWLASRLKVPAILFLLLAGILAGPVAQMVLGHKLIDPATIFGELVYPIVSLSVAVILFEGGLTLNLSELSEVGKTLIYLVTIGAAATWLIAAVTAHFILGMPWPLAILLGSILVVTGPTVIGPLLRHIRPVGSVGPLLRWEGIVIDPIGALLALLVFESIHATALPHMAGVIALSIARTILFGSLIGFAGAALLVLMLRKFWIADHLQNPVTLGLLVTAFAGANLLQDESGLLAVTVMGIALTNQRFVPVKHILEFKETLSILLVSSLFVLLGSRLDSSQLSQLGFSTLVFVGVLILIARPAAVWLATIRSNLGRNERIFLAFLAPRGIIAAAVASVFALRLRQAGVPGAERLVPTTFAVIVATVLVYGIGSPLLARKLKVATRGRGGFVIAGANPLAAAIAMALKNEKQDVLVVDTNHARTSAVRLAGVPTLTMSIVSNAVIERLEDTGIGRLLALTPNEEVNTLASMHLARLFGRSRVFQLATEKKEKKTDHRTVSHDLAGRILFGSTHTFEHLSRRIERGDVFKRTTFTPGFSYENFQIQHSRDDILPLFYSGESGELFVIAIDEPFKPRVGQSLIYLTGPKDEPAEVSTDSQTAESGAASL